MINLVSVSYNNLTFVLSINHLTQKMINSDKKSLLLIPNFEKFISHSKYGKRQCLSGKPVANGTLVQYNSVLKLLVAFEKDQNVTFRILILNKNNQKTNYAEKLYWKRFFRNLTLWLYKKKCLDNYISNIAKTLRTFFNYLLKERCLQIGTFHYQFKVKTQAISPIVLEPQQLRFLITNQSFKDKLTPKLQKLNDIFVFGCTVGLRYNDFKHLKRTNIQNTDNGCYILLNTSKTGSQVKIPLPNYAIEIIDKYRRKSKKFVLPQLSNVNFNKGIKELIEVAGWTYNYSKIRFKQGKAIEINNTKGNSYRFCDHITAHTMRRTAITTLLLLGVEENIVRTISGHSPGSKEFYKYVALVQNHLNKQVLNAFEKLIISSQFE